MSWIALAVALTLPRVAHASCTIAGCTQIGEVCHLDICVPCVTNYEDGGLSSLLAACQDPSAPICDLPDGSIGGSCVQCTESSQCAGGTCDLATNTCSDAGAGDAGLGDAGEHDAAADGSTLGSDGGAGDASTSDAGERDGASSDSGSADATTANDGSSGDGSAATDGAASDDGAASEDGATSQDGASQDGATSEDASLSDAAASDGGGLDGSFVEGGGCSCDAVGGSTSFGGAAFGLLALAAGVARRRRR